MLSLQEGSRLEMNGQVPGRGGTEGDRELGIRERSQAGGIFSGVLVITKITFSHALPALQVLGARVGGEGICFHTHSDGGPGMCGASIRVAQRWAPAL